MSDKRCIGRPVAIPAWLTEFAVLLVVATVDLLVWSNDNGLRGGGEVEPWLIPAGSIASLATLLLRRRLPVPVLVVQLAWASLCGLAFTEYNPIAGILVALNALARYQPPARSLPGWAACLLPCGIYALDRGDVQWQLTFLLVLMLIAGTTWLLGYRTRLADQRAAERDVAAADAVRSERLRIARELHDIVSHAVSVMVLQAAGARAVLGTDPHRAEAALDIVQDVGSQSMNELRRLLCLLRAASDDPDVMATEQPDLNDLDALLANTRAAGLAVSEQVWGTPGLLDPSVGLAAYRLVQEALTNTLKHAGPEAAARVGLNWEPEQLTITVQDDGPPPGGQSATAVSLSTGHGLLGLRERVQTVGGTLHAGPTGTGFVVQAVLPTALRSPSIAPTSPLASSAAERIVT
ncbi:sensor histidine kinase [Actinoplanes italicus]|nr:histidine kinase [Actinoplanes italicus]